MILRTLLTLGVTVFAAQAMAIPLPNKTQHFTQLPFEFTANYDFEGIVALNNCSASLVRFHNSKETDKGIVLTNGHCYERGFLNPGVVLVNRPSSRRITLLDKNGNSLGRLNATKVMYGTMTKTDMLLYEVDKTFAEIETQFRTRPFTLADVRSAPGTGIEVVSGYWTRGYSCQIEAIIPELREGGWVWQEAIRYSRPGCQVIGGTSGSPVIEAGTRTVIGVNNTGNMNGERCTRDNPCEVDENGNVTYQKGFSYGEQTYWIYSCLDGSNQVDVNIPGCQLPH